jgi:cysteine-rich repeat protein
VKLRYQRRDGSTKWPKNINSPGGGSFGRGVASLGDIDGDGSTEIAVGTWDNRVWIMSLGKGCFTCGNGSVEPGEACDDDNVVSGDGCSSSCQDERNWALEDPHVKYPPQGSSEMYLGKSGDYGDQRYTIESWFKPKVGTDIDCVVCGGQTWKLSLAGDDIQFKYRCGNGGDYKVLTYDTAITTKWHHIALVGRWQGDRKHTLWVDGVNMGTQTLSCNLYGSSGHYGFEVGPGEFYSDEAALTWGARYQKTFTPDQPLRRPANIHVWWALEEGAGGIAGDGADKGWMGEIFEGEWHALPD